MAEEREADLYELQRCVVPRCEEAVYLAWRTSQALYRMGAAEDYQPQHSEVADWHVECENGHRIATSRTSINGIDERAEFTQQDFDFIAALTQKRVSAP